MAFDEAKWREAATAEGYSKEDQDAYIASLKTAEPAASKPFGAATEQFVQQGQAEQAAAKQARDVQAGPFTIPDWMTPALGAAAAGALGYGAKALVDKLRTPAPAPFTPIEPSFDIAPEPAAAPAPDPLKEAKLREAEAKARLQELKLEKAQQGKAPVAPPAPAPTPPVQTPANIAQVQQQAAEALAARQAVAPPPVAPPAAAPAAPVATAAPVTTAAPVATTPAAPVTTAAPVAPATSVAPTALAAPVAKTPAAKEKKAREKLTFKAPTDLPEGTTFRSDLGTGDKWLINTTGPERRKLILNELNQGKPAGSYEEGVKLYKQYLEKYPKESFGPVLPPEEAKARGIKPPESFGGWGKAVKVGGTAGLLLTAAELAQAAQKAKQDKGASLKELAFNAIGMIPGLGTAFNAMTFSGGLNTNEEQELARRRGIAPPVQR